MTGTSFEEDDLHVNISDVRLLRRLWAFTRPYARQLALALVLLAGTALAELAPPYLVRLAIDGPIAAGDAEGLLPIFALYLSALLAAFSCRYGQTYLMQTIGQQVMVDLRLRLFSHIQRMSMAFFDRNPIGRLTTRLTNDVEALNLFLTQGLVSLLGDSVRLIFIVVTMLLLNWRLALISFMVLPLVGLATISFQRAMRPAFRALRQQLARLNAFLNEQITGIQVIQLFNREEERTQQLEQIGLAYRALEARTLITFLIFWSTVTFLGITATALLLNLGGQTVLGGLATVGLLVAFIQYTQQAFQPIQQLAEGYNALQSAMAATERIFRVLDTLPDVQDPPSPGSLPQPVQGTIAFNNVWFRYQQGRENQVPEHGQTAANAADPGWVLRGISFTIPAGQAVAVVGATGAGKTSLISLMARFYDIQHGSIALDGVDIRAIRQADLRRHIAAVPQDPACFRGTIAENIRLHNETITDAQVRRAAEVVNAAPFIERLPGGYDYEVRERGANLSAGQRQLLAFARAIAFNPEVLLILDEATSSVDTEAEALIQQALERLLKGRTSIVIAHRLATIRHVDRIIVLHQGRVVEDGMHSQLLSQRGYYHRLYQQQFAGHAHV